MKIGSLEKLFAAAVAAALTLPAVAQERSQSAAGQTGGARSSEAGQNDAASGVNRSAGQSGASGRSGAAGGVGSAAQDRANQGTIGGESGTRTANFPPQSEGSAAGQQGQRGQLNDQGLVRWVAAGNEAEIRVNEAARQQARNEQVKQFAQKMVQEHTQLGQKLQQAAQGGQGGQRDASDQPAASGRSGRGESGSGQGTQGTQGTQGEGASGRRSGADRQGGANGAGNASGDDSVSFLQDGQEGAGRGQGRAGAVGAMRAGNNPFLALHEEIKRQCAESTIQALRQKQGAEFDHAFMHQQIVEHMTMIDTLKVAQQHASPDLQAALQEAQHHAQQHLDQAKQIVEQLDKEGQR